MQIIECDLTRITHGVVAHQINCTGAIGTGVSGAILATWPASAGAYQDLFPLCTGVKGRYAVPRPELLGSYAVAEVAPNLRVAHVFGQVGYGNAAKTKRIYTDVPALVSALTNLVEEARANGWGPVHVPYGIGCGLAGASWDVVAAHLEPLPIIICKLP